MLRAGHPLGSRVWLGRRLCPRWQRPISRSQVPPPWPRQRRRGQAHRRMGVADSFCFPGRGGRRRPPLLMTGRRPPPPCWPTGIGWPRPTYDPRW